MSTVVLVIHLLLAVALVAVILLQRSEGGALGIGGGGGGGGFLTARGTANLLTRTTAILATGFIVTSMTLAHAGRPCARTVHDPRQRAGRAGAVRACSTGAARSARGQLSP